MTSYAVVLMTSAIGASCAHEFADHQAEVLNMGTADKGLSMCKNTGKRHGCVCICMNFAS